MSNSVSKSGAAHPQRPVAKHNPAPQGSASSNKGAAKPSGASGSNHSQAPHGNASSTNGSAKPSGSSGAQHNPTPHGSASSSNGSPKSSGSSSNQFGNTMNGLVNATGGNPSSNASGMWSKIMDHVGSSFNQSPGGGVANDSPAQANQSAAMNSQNDSAAVNPDASGSIANGKQTLSASAPAADKSPSPSPAPSPAPANKPPAPAPANKPPAPAPANKPPAPAPANKPPAPAPANKPPAPAPANKPPAPAAANKPPAPAPGNHSAPAPSLDVAKKSTASPVQQDAGSANASVDGGGPKQLTLKDTTGKPIQVGLFENSAPGMHPNVNGANDTYSLQPGQSQVLSMPANWQGRAQEMTGSASDPATWAELNFENKNGQDKTWFDESMIRGYNSAVTISDGQGTTAGSDKSVLGGAPAGITTTDSGGNKVIKPAEPYTGGTDQNVVNYLDQAVGNTNAYIQNSDNAATKSSNSNKLLVNFGNA